MVRRSRPGLGGVACQGGRGRSRSGWVGLVKSRQGAARRSRHGSSPRCMASLVTARLGGLGPARHSKSGLGMAWRSRRGWSGPVTAWRGGAVSARQGDAMSGLSGRGGHGEAWRGLVSPVSSWHGWFGLAVAAEHGMAPAARLGQAWWGQVTCGASRHGWAVVAGQGGAVARRFLSRRGPAVVARLVRSRHVEASHVTARPGTARLVRVWRSRRGT